MGTSAGYTPVSAPECPYAPRMTRAAALALRAASGLRENCVVVIIDYNPGGTLGAAEIELNPTAPDDLGLTARVNTTFDDSAWAGLYDIDTNRLVELRDNLGNTVKDTDGVQDTILTFPWGSATWTDNYFEDVNLTAPNAALAVVNNEVRNSVLDMTGWAAGSMQNNIVEGLSFVRLGATTGNLTFNQNQVRDGATVNALGGAAVGITRNTIEDASNVTYTAGAAGNHTLSSNYITAGVNFTVSATNVGATNISNSRFNGVANYTVNKPGGNLTVVGADHRGVTANLAGSSLIALSAATIASTTVTEQAGAAGQVSTSSATIISSTINLNSTWQAGASLNINLAADVRQTTVTMAGLGRCDITSGARVASSSLVTTANSRGFNLGGGTYSFSLNVTAPATAATDADQFFDCDFRGGSITQVTMQGTPGAGSRSMNRCRLVDTVVTVNCNAAAVGAGAYMQQTEAIGSTLTFGASNPGAGTNFTNRSRFVGANVDFATFFAQESIIEGLAGLAGASKVLIANVQNRLANKSFDDWGV